MLFPQLLILASITFTSNQFELLENPHFQDLQSDQVQWNATNTHYTFIRSKAEIDVEALQKAFEEGDAQSQTSIVDIVKRRSIKPWRTIIERAVEDLKDDRGTTEYYFRRANAKTATIYLWKWWSETEPFVRAALSSKDPQQRLRAALIVAFARSEKDMPEALPILLPHLYDNEIMEDARLVVPAIFRFGPKAIPLLLAELKHADQQAHAILLHMIERLENPDRHYNECRNRMPTITIVVHDPLTSSLEQVLEGYSGLHY
ncbi:MAG: hypothetical protein QGI78_03010 [Phycisphaerales bacterium]|jgi:hypothetical protein|nr:hypothetical protein [Phycisphaerales bacterium]